MTENDQKRLKDEKKTKLFFFVGYVCESCQCVLLSNNMPTLVWTTENDGNPATIAKKGAKNDENDENDQKRLKDEKNQNCFSL